ncbi:UNVERIFIED_CONTAM: hypothetical protein K2H54_001586 [Gekko kuhli]
MQQLQRVLTTGTTRGMHIVAETCTASSGDSRAFLATRADGSHRHGTEPVCIGQLAATKQCRRPGADDRQRLEAVLREADLADITDQEDYSSRPGAAPRLEHFPMLGRPTQHVANAATAAASAPDDPWRCPTTPYTECGPTHRAGGTCLWTEQGNIIEEHRVLQTPFSPHLMRTLVIRPEPGRWAAVPLRDEGTEADNGGEARESSGVQPRPDHPGTTTGRHQGTHTTWEVWWQATKAAVACRCHDLEQEYAQRCQQRYQATLRRMLVAEDILAHGGNIDLDQWHHDVAVVRQEERHRREQRHREHMLHARGAPVTWQ